MLKRFLSQSKMTVVMIFAVGFIAGILAYIKGIIPASIQSSLTKKNEVKK